MAARHRIWAQAPPLPRREFVAMIQAIESSSVEGVWCSQTFGSPFGPLCAAAVVSERLQLGSGIALAFVRSPLETACTIMDLDRLSDGRAVLGLGSSGRSLTEGAFGAPYGRPLAHMREVVGMIRAIVAGAYEGGLGVLEGEHHRLDLEHFRTLSPPVRKTIPIHLPAVFEKACVQAGEIADGLLGHPLWNERWIHEQTEPSLAEGLARAGRERQAIDLNLMMFVAVNEDRREAIEDCRTTIAYYTQSPQYSRYFDYIGFGDEARAIQAAFAAHDPAAMNAACPDEMVESIALVGPPDEVRRRMLDRARSADSCTPVIPHIGLGPDKEAFYAAGIADLFYG